MAHERRGRARRNRDATRVGLSITPMIDVVFQLLVYFLLGAGVVGAERHLRAEMPPDAPATAERAFALEDEPLVVAVRRDAAVTLSGGLAQPADLDALRATLRDALLTPDRPGGLFTPEHPVRIAAAPDVAWEDVVRVYEAVVAAGYRSVAFGGSR
jgi:biopolymer transport protein ExbD